MMATGQRMGVLARRLPLLHHGRAPCCMAACRSISSGTQTQRQVLRLVSTAPEQPLLHWTRRKRGAVERAAGIGADAAAAAAAAQQTTADGARGHQPAELGGPGHGAGAAATRAADSDAVGAPSSEAPTPEQRVPPRRQSQLPIGAFQRLPQVQVASEQLSSGLRKAQRLASSKTIKNEAAKARNRTARQMDFVMKALTGPLATYAKGFPPPPRLHPFERALLDLTVREARYVGVLQRVDALRKKLTEVGKNYAARCARCGPKKEALAAADEGFAALEGLFLKGAPAVDELVEVARSLRRLPLVDPFLPTVALVGAPNVGKSSLVALLSSGAPEVCDYPFTTRSIAMGHFFVSGRRHQVTDTPGLLRRPEDERNAMERLTLAALAHLPTAAVFVADLTGACGTSVADQWAIRRSLRERFPGKLWLDVLSKGDLLEEEFDAADGLEAAEALAAAEAAAGADTPAGGLQSEGDGAGSTSAAAGTRASVWSGAGGSNDGVRAAVHMAAALPHALRVSATSKVGIDELKEATVRLLSERAFAEQLATGHGPSGLEGGFDSAQGGQQVDRGLLGAAEVEAVPAF